MGLNDGPWPTQHHRKKEAPEEVAPRASGCPPRLLPDPARTEGAATRASGYARRKSGQATVDGCGKRAGRGFAKYSGSSLCLRSLPFENQTPKFYIYFPKGGRFRLPLEISA